MPRCAGCGLKLDRGTPDHFVGAYLVNLIIAVKMAQLPPEQVEQMKDAIDQQKQVLFRNLLQMEIQTKLGYLAFVKTVPKEKLPDLRTGPRFTHCVATA